MGKIESKGMETILRSLHANRQVIIPPTPGFDAGVHRIPSGKWLVISTDPCVNVPTELFGWLLVNYSASDVSVLGVQPSYCAIDMLAPPSRGAAASIKVVLKQAYAAARKIGIYPIAGHSGTYDGLDRLVGVCTTYGFARPTEIVRPDGAKPGDLIFCTKPLGIECVVNFALMNPRVAKRIFTSKELTRVKRQAHLQTCVGEALALARRGCVTAMHDVTEGGIVAAVNQMAQVSRSGFHVDYSSVPISTELNRLKEFFHLSGVEVLSASSSGMLIAAVPPVLRLRAMKILQSVGCTPKIIGRFTASKERRIIRDEDVRPFPERSRDPYSKIVSARSLKL